MDILNMIKTEFKDVTNALFENQDGFKFLRIYTTFTNIEDVTEITHRINDFIDKHDNTEETYFLDVSSRGTEYEIDFEEVQIDDHIKLSFNKPFKEHEFLEGSLIDKTKDSLLLKWNNKGQIKKTEFILSDIKKINKSAKIKKAKKKELKNEKNRTK